MKLSLFLALSALSLSCSIAAMKHDDPITCGVTAAAIGATSGFIGEKILPSLFERDFALGLTSLAFMGAIATIAVYRACGQDYVPVAGIAALVSAGYAWSREPRHSIVVKVQD